MPGAIHEIAVQKILEKFPAAKTHGFRRGLLKATQDAVFKQAAMLPDAFVIDLPKRFVIVFEVEASHPVSDDKMRVYGDLYWALNLLEWEFALITFDRWGQQRAIIDVGDFEIRRLVRETPVLIQDRYGMREWVAAIRAAGEFL